MKLWYSSTNEDILEDYALTVLQGVLTDELHFTPEDLVELTLRNRISSHLARILTRYLTYPDRKGVWERYLRSNERVYGPDWEIIAKKALREGNVSCPSRGCMELAVGETCDRCLTRGW
jgi:hypothetical protein